MAGINDKSQIKRMMPGEWNPEEGQGVGASLPAFPAALQPSPTLQKPGKGWNPSVAFEMKEAWLQSDLQCPWQLIIKGKPSSNFGGEVSKEEFVCLRVS